MADTATPLANLKSTRAQTRVLAVGDWQHREFVAAATNLSNHNDWSLAANIDQACDHLSHCQQPPELIFLAQRLPGLFCQEQVDHLQQLVPLARLILVAGSWCEGELRTGTPPGGVIRLYWYELALWWQAAVRRRIAGKCPLWSLPLDHVQAGRWSSDFCFSPPIDAGYSVLIDAADYAVYETLAAALATYDIRSSWKGHGDWNHQAPSDTCAATAGLWDGGQLSDHELTRLTHFCQQMDGPVLALLDFPRVEHLEQAFAAGAAAVFAKPYVIEELVAAFGQQPQTGRDGRLPAVS